MHTIWHNLLWKEWREHRWKLAALVAICVGVPLLAGAVEFETGSFYLAFSSSIVPYVILAGAFLGINIAAGENSTMTAPFLQSLPTANWQPGFAKLVAAIVTGVVPLLITAGLVYLVAALSPASWQAYLWEYRGFSNVPREASFEHWLLICVGCGSLAVVSLIIWVAAAGVNRRDEIRAGAAAAVLVAVCLSLIGWIGSTFVLNHDPPRPLPVWFQMLSAAGPACLAILLAIFDLEKSRSSLDELFVLNYGAVFIAIIISHCLLTAWYLSHFNRAVRVSRETSDGVASITQLRAPWRSPLVAVVWKQFRELGPLVTLGLVCLIGLVAWDVFSSGNYDSATVVSYLAWVILDAFAVLGGVVALLIGIGVFAGDLNPGLNEFWRSRPVSPNLWFWTKFLMGLAITVVALGGPMLLALPYHDPMEHPQRDLQPEMIIGFAIHVLLYCGAVVSMTLVRRPFYAAIFAFSIVLFGMVMVEFVLPRLFGLFEFNPWEVLAYALALSAAITPVAWLAVRNDWNWSR